MDIKPESQKTQPISDDQELAKVLAGISDQSAGADATVIDMADPVLPPTPMPAAPVTTDDEVVATENKVETNVSEPLMPAGPMPAAPALDPMPTSDSGDASLDGIKQEALGELRPLVDKLNVSPEEKFDTYLLLLRSTDDRELIAPAHEAAKNITDEARRAQALLDIIKEIDFLSQPAA